MPARKQWKFDLEISEKYTKEEREAIAQETIDFIVERTQKGLDKNNSNFKPYSKSYKNSLNFKIAGKGAGVDLTLSGDMLSAIKALRDTKGKITIGFDKGLENDKAEGNILGTYGQPKPVAPPRDFLGITKTDFKNEILSKYPIRDREESRKRADKVIKAMQTARDIAEGDDEDGE